MKEFELLPSEEQMRDMARAYKGIKIRQDIMDGSLCDNTVKQPCDSGNSLDDKPLPCQNNKAAIACMAKAYYLQRDIQQAMKRLHSIAPHMYRDNIAEIIKMKCQNTEYLLGIYTQLSCEQLSYAPNLYNGRNYCRTLGEICSLQEKLLAKLIDLDECPQTLWLTSREIVVATALNRMSIYCLFNR